MITLIKRKRSNQILNTLQTLKKMKIYLLSHNQSWKFSLPSPNCMKSKTAYIKPEYSESNQEE